MAQMASKGDSYLMMALEKAKKDPLNGGALEQAFIDSLIDMDTATEVLKTMTDTYNSAGNDESMGKIKTVILAIFYYQLDNFIKQAIHRYAGEYLNTDPLIFEDLQNECFMVLADNIKNYDPEKSAPITYFRSYFMHKIIEFNDKKFQNASSHYGNKSKRIRQRMEELKAVGIIPTAEGIARDLNMPVTTVKGCMDIIGNANLIYIESIKEEADKNALEGRMTNNERSPEDIYLEIEADESVKDILATLAPIERKICCLSIFSSLNNKDIAARLNITPGMVATHYNRAMARLRVNPKFRMYKERFDKRIQQRNRTCENYRLKACQEDVAIRTEKYVISLFTEGDGTMAAEN